MNVAAALGAIIGPMAIGALTKRDPVNGWRDFYVSGKRSRFSCWTKSADENV
jgi:hypothetical protein